MSLKIEPKSKWTQFSMLRQFVRILDLFAKSWPTILEKNQNKKYENNVARNIIA